YLVEVGSAGQMQVGPRIVNDAERAPKPVLTVKECFAHSSNVGMSKLAYKAFANNPKEFKEYIHRFHLDAPSGIDLKDVPKPRMAPLDNKNGGLMNMITMSFGYAIQLSPLHTLTLYNAVANNGKMVKPFLVNSIRLDGNIIEQFQPTVEEEKIGTKLYAMYVEKKDATNCSVIKDSSDYFYAGSTKDIKNVFSKLNVSYKDSAMRNTWAHVFAQDAMPVMKGIAVQQKIMPNVK